MDAIRTRNRSRRRGAVAAASGAPNATDGRSTRGVRAAGRAVPEQSREAAGLHCPCQLSFASTIILQNASILSLSTLDDDDDDTVCNLRCARRSIAMWMGRHWREPMRKRKRNGTVRVRPCVTRASERPPKKERGKRRAKRDKPARCHHRGSIISSRSGPPHRLLPRNKGCSRNRRLPFLSSQSPETRDPLPCPIHLQRCTGTQQEELRRRASPPGRW